MHSIGRAVAVQAVKVQAAAESLMESIRGPDLDASSSQALEQEHAYLQQEAADIAAMQKLLSVPVTLYPVLQQVCGND